MQKWEYATVPLISHALQEILNQWGEDGWELVQVLESQATGTTGFFKRPEGLELFCRVVTRCRIATFIDHSAGGRGPSTARSGRPTSPASAAR